MKFPRVIPTLLIQGGYLVKGKQFRNHRYVGDGINAIRIYNEKLVDEICIFNIENNKSENNLKLLSEMSSEAFVPLSYGGQISTIEEVKAIFDLGIEKIIFNSALHNNQELIAKTARIFGAQSVVLKIDYKTTIFGKQKVVFEGQRKSSKQSLIECLNVAEALGAGEIILASIDRDGCGTGYDLETLKAAVEETNIPILGSCGAASVSDIKKAIVEAKCSGVTLGDMVTFYGPHQAVLPSYPDFKELLEIWN